MTQARRQITRASMGVFVVAILYVVAPLPAAPADDDAHAQSFSKVVRPFIQKHCVACHGVEKQEGEVRFDGPLPDLVEPKLAEQWLSAKLMMAQGEMPPKGRPRPTADELTPVLAWIDDAAARAATITRGGIGRRALRRLTPREYVSTSLDVLGLSFPHFPVDLSRRLPQDSAEDNFSNDSNQQSTQPLLLRRSLDLAEHLVDVALPEEPHLGSIRYEVDVREFAAKAAAKLTKPQNNFVAYRDDVPAVGDGKPASLSLVGRWSGPNNGRRPQAVTRLDAKRGIVLAPNPVVIGNPMECLTLRLPLVPDGGILRLRAKAGASIPAGETSPVLRLSIAREFVIVPVGEIVVTAPADSPAEYVLEAPLALADADWKGIHRDGHLELQIDNAAALVEPALRSPDEKRKEGDIPLPTRNELLVSSLAVEVVETPSRSPHLLAPSRAGESDRDRARRSLEAFLPQAFRRPARASEVAAHLGLYDAERARGVSFLSAYKAAVTAALISPQMFYLVEPKDAEQRPLTAWELASRLSYLAWGTAPDEELQARAADGGLLREDELRRQLARLLDDPRSYALCREFARQWLDLDSVLHLDPATVVAHQTINQKEDIPWNEDVLRRDMVEEAPRLFEELLRKNRPVESLVGCEIVVINDRLARFYGIDGVSGHQFRAVPAPADRRGGLLTQAGCIAAASHGRERAEILRGVYLIERILGIDIPTPPGNVQPLDVQLNIDKNLRKLSPREHVEAHSSINTCAVCHLRIDPLSFAWDQYDLFGRLRRDKDGKLIAANTSGQLPDKTPFADIEEFRRRLIEPPAETRPTPRFTDAFSRRLYAYVLGRSLDHGDDEHLEAIHATAAKAKGGLRDLLTAMVLSKPFLQK
ncbi:DUF1592 domain-containing protein [Lignipirellula cremea]|uniref:Cytochrome c domain-containing protein n=1 Tax=Lignipirellula cremea TaxID=2528010 RepID=A0A518DXI2_9BACT|nr:hypothetical protein Pla8534_43670 [Lignipirellula cremea]